MDDEHTDVHTQPAGPAPEHGGEPIGPIDKEERTWALGCHLITFSGGVIPFGHIVGPLVLWLLKKDEMPLVDDQGKEALNFQISVTIYAIISGVLSILLIGIPLLVAVLIFDFVMTVVAAMKAYDGEYYRYPLTIRFVT